MSVHLTLRNLYPGVPNTSRGEASHVSSDPTTNTSLIAYASGRVAVVRSVQDPLEARVFSQHSAPVTYACFSPDGTQIASADESGSIRIWDVQNALQKTEMQVYVGSIRSLSFSPDAKFLAVTGDNRGAFAKVVKVPSGGSAGICAGHTKRTITCDVVKGFVATGSEDLTVGVFKGPPVREIDTPKFYRHHSGFVNKVRFSPNAKFLAIASTDRAVSIVEMASDEVVCTIAEHSGSVTSIVWIDDNNLITSSNDKTNKFWSIPEGKCLRTITFGNDVKDMQVECALSKKGGETVSVSLRPQLNIIPPGQDVVGRIIRGHSKQIIGLAAIGGTVYTADYSGHMVAWEMGVGSKDLNFSGKGPATSVCAIAGNEDVVANIGLDGKIFITPTSNLKYCKPVTVKGGGVDIAVPKTATSAFSAVAVNETRLVAISADGTSIVAELKFKNGETGTSVGVSCDGLIAVGIEMGEGSAKLCFYTLRGSSFSEAGAAISMISSPNKLAFSPNGEHIAVGEKSRRVRLYSTKSKETITGGGLAHTGRVDAVAFSSDGRLVASGGMDGSIAVWPVDSEEEAARLKPGHRNGVTGIAFISEKCIVTSGGDSCLRTWNM